MILRHIFPEILLNFLKLFIRHEEIIYQYKLFLLPSKSRHVNISVSSHQIIYCTRKNNKTKTGGVLKHVTFSSFKKYAVEAYKDALKKVNFQNFELLNDVNKAYSNFFQKNKDSC